MKKTVIVLWIVIALIATGYYGFPEKTAGYLIGVARLSAGLNKKEIQIDDHRIVYLEGGHGPDVLLLHGYSADKDNWTRFAYYLKGYHVIIPDIPGFGESSRITEDNYNLNSQIERLHNFVRAVGLTKFHIAGNSMGGWLAGVYAVRYPGEVASLGLFDSGGVKSPEKSEVTKLIEKGENPFLLKDRNDLPRILKLIFVKVPTMPFPVKEMFIRDSIANRSFNNKMLKDIGNDITGLEKNLPKIKAPALILWGDKDKVIDISSVPVFEKGLKNHKTVILKNCGHIPMMEKPKKTAAVYMEFLKNLEK